MSENPNNTQSPEGAYKVGYKHPPKSSQFKTGVSGNPKGRPKGAKTLKSVVISVAKSKVVLKEGNTAMKLSKLEASVAILAMNALKGDTKAMALLLKLFTEHLPTEADQPKIHSEPSPEDLAVLESKAKILELLENASHG